MSDYYSALARTLAGEADPANLTISALGGPPVEVDTELFRRLAGRAGVEGPDLNRAELGRLIWAAKQHGSTSMLAALLEIRSTSPIFRVRRGGLPWRRQHPAQEMS